MRTRRFRALGLLLTAAGVALTGCNDDGRTLEPTSATMPPSTETTTTLPVGEAIGMRLTSPDVLEGALLGASFTCEADRAPTLVFSGAPTAAAELAVAVVDLDADERVHLVASGLPNTTIQLDLAQLPEAAVLGRSAGGTLGWEPPCPAPGDPAHRFEARLYANPEPIGLAPGLGGPDAVALIEAAAVEVARLGFTVAPPG